MKRGLYHFLTAVMLAVLFLLYTTVGYGSYSDTLNMSCSVTGFFPASIPSEDGEHATMPPEGNVGTVEESTLDTAAEDSPSNPEPTATPALENLEPKVSISRELFIDNGGSANKTVPFFIGSYTDRSGNHVQLDENPVCHLERNTLVAYASVFVPQNGLPGSAILTEMCIDMGAAIRFDNTTGSEIMLTRTSISNGMEQSFFNDSAGTLAGESMRLAPGQTGVVSAYLGQGWQLNASELDLENLSGMLCPCEYKMTFQTENLKTGENHTYAILLEISVSTTAPVDTPLPTEGKVAIVTPSPIPETTPVPAVEPTPSPVPTEAAIPPPTPEATEAPAVEPTPSPVSTETAIPTPSPEITETPAAEPTPSPVSTEMAIPTPLPEITETPAAEPTPSPVSTETAIPTPTSEAKEAPAIEPTPNLVSTVAVTPVTAPESIPDSSPEAAHVPEPTTKAQASTPELLPDTVIPD